LSVQQNNPCTDSERHNPYAFFDAAPTEEQPTRVTLFDIGVAILLAGFAGVIGLVLGPMLAWAVTAGELFSNWASPDNSLRRWVVITSLLFSPLLAVLAFRGHLQSVRERRASLQKRKE